MIEGLFVFIIEALDPIAFWRHAAEKEKHNDRHDGVCRIDKCN